MTNWIQLRWEVFKDEKERSKNKKEEDMYASTIKPCRDEIDVEDIECSLSTIEQCFVSWCFHKKHKRQKIWMFAD